MGLSRAHFLEIGVYEETLAQLGGWPYPQRRDPAQPTLYFYCKQPAKFCKENVWLAQGNLGRWVNPLPGETFLHIHVTLATLFAAIRVISLLQRI